MKKNKTGSSQVGAISKAQKYSKNNYWKHLEKFFSKKNIEIFFSKKVFFLENRTMPQKVKKRPFRLIERFYKPKTSKNAIDRIRKFSKKKSHSAEKKRKKSNETKQSFGLASTFGNIKNLWFSARIEPTISCFSEK